MSIVTDALNRLQSMRAHVERSPVDHDPQPSPSNETDSHDAPYESRGHTKFLTVSIGSFLVISTMAMGAYWWGESLVVGVPQLTFSMPSYADEPPIPFIESPNDVLPSDQQVSNLTELNPDEFTADVRDLVSEEMEQEGIMSTSQEGEEQTFDQVASVVPQELKVSHLEVEETENAVTSNIPEESEFLINNDAQEVDESLSKQIDNRSKLTNSEGVISLSLAIADKDRPSHVASLSIADSEETQRSGASLNLLSLEHSGKQLFDRSPEISDLRPQHSSQDLEVKTAQPLSRTNVSSEQLLGRRVEDEARKAPIRLSPEQRLARAQTLIAQQFHAEALQVLNPLFATLPTTWEPWFWLGTAQLGVGDLDKAENAFMEGLVRDETVPHLWVQRAVIAQQRGQHKSAMDALRQAEFLAPDLPEVQLNLAYNFDHEGNTTLALRHYKQYLSLTEGKASYHRVRRKVLERVIRRGNS